MDINNANNTGMFQQVASTSVDYIYFAFCLLNMLFTEIKMHFNCKKCISWINL